ncbi:MAG: hypothetical protein DRO89_05000 [Candidatus Altiarchaeales archaeon]|nr:MAG: hypothetical protein DRO89_05000 [Candidatus Altiarchaeales archaeon]
MATILGGDITVVYFNDNRGKFLYWSGSSSGTRTMNEVYSAMATLLDESTTIDDGSCMSAETPTEYTIGKIDAGDNDPWYITFDCMEHITGGALQTSGWERSTGTNTGIVIAPVTASSNNIVDTDRGKDIVHADGDSGTLLEVIDTGGATDYIVIRPDSNEAANDFDSTSGNLTCNGHTAPQNAEATTGEMVWANLYSIGTIAGDTHIYLYQGIISDSTPSRARVYSWNDNTQDWWGDGHIDVCVALKDITDSTWSVIDDGYITALARKYGHEYDNFEVACSTTSGGRNPIPLATATDLNNTTGYKSITTTSVATDDFSVGDEIQGGTSGARAIITKIEGSDPTYTFHYYLIDDPLTDFQTAAETITNNDGTGSATKDGNAPADQGPALATWFTNNTFPTISVGNTTADIDDDGNDEYYGITVNCNSNPLTEVYEWLKYATRRGETTNDIDGLNAEQYIGAEVALSWTGTVTGTIAEGGDVTQATSGATGVIISYHNDSNGKKLLLRNVRGTFDTTHTITDNDNSGTVTPNDFATAFSPTKKSPLGTFAGGTFFGARGVLLTNYISADENSFILTPIEGGTKERPTAITLEITNLVGTDETTSTDDIVGVFRLTTSGGDINKAEYDCSGGESIGDTTIAVSSSIAQDVPGKTSGGVLMLVDDPAGTGTEYRLRYSSWSSSTFTLANIDITSADAGTNTTTIVESGAFTNAKRGDLVYNHDRSAVSYVTTVDSANQVTISPAISGQTTGDHIELNCVPIVTTSSDDLYVPLIHGYPTTSSMSSSIVYSSTIYFRAKVRNTRATTKIKPFSTDDSLTGSDKSIAVVRTEDKQVT